VFGVALLSVAILTAGGCDSSSSVTIEPPSDTSDEPNRVTTIGLALPLKGYLESYVWEQIFRLEATRSGILSEVVHSEPGEQAATLSKLVERHPDALVVAPDLADPKLRQVIEQVVAQGVPVVLLDHPIAGLSLPVVKLEPFSIAAKKLVDAAVEDAKKQGLSPKGPAVLMVNGPFDDKGRARVDAIHAALRDAGIESLPDAVFQGFMKEAGDTLQAVLDKHPEVSIVIADEDQGARAAGTVRDGLPPENKRFVLAAFGDGNEVARMAKFNQFAGLAERDLDRQTREALQAAISAVKGQAPPSEIVIPLKFARAAGEPMRNMMREGRSRPPDDPGVPLKGIKAP
jgi:ABC-type sugar transport system substrate-binding protein